MQDITIGTDFILTPYRGVRYHLKEQEGAKSKPGCKEELFHLRHSSLRNTANIWSVKKKISVFLIVHPNFPF